MKDRLEVLALPVSTQSNAIALHAHLSAHQLIFRKINVPLSSWSSFGGMIELSEKLDCHIALIEDIVNKIRTSIVNLKEEGEEYNKTDSSRIMGNTLSDSENKGNSTRMHLGNNKVTLRNTSSINPKRNATGTSKRTSQQIIDKERSKEIKKIEKDPTYRPSTNEGKINIAQGSKFLRRDCLYTFMQDFEWPSKYSELGLADLVRSFTDDLVLLKRNYEIRNEEFEKKKNNMLCVERLRNGNLQEKALKHILNQYNYKSDEHSYRKNGQTDKKEDPGIVTQLEILSVADTEVCKPKRSNHMENEQSNKSHSTEINSGTLNNSKRLETVNSSKNNEINAQLGENESMKDIEDVGAEKQPHQRDTVPGLKDIAHQKVMNLRNSGSTPVITSEKDSLGIEDNSNPPSKQDSVAIHLENGLEVADPDVQEIIGHSGVNNEQLKYDINIREDFVEDEFLTDVFIVRRSDRVRETASPSNTQKERDGILLRIETVCSVGMFELVHFLGLKGKTEEIKEICKDRDWILKEQIDEDFMGEDTFRLYKKNFYTFLSTYMLESMLLLACLKLTKIYADSVLKYGLPVSYVFFLVVVDERKWKKAIEKFEFMRKIEWKDVPRERLKELGI